MKKKILGLVLAALMAAPGAAVAKDDCKTRSEWKPVTNDAPSDRVKVKIALTNKMSPLLTATIYWTDNEGVEQPSKTLSMVKGQTASHTMTISGKKGTPSFRTAIGNYGDAKFLLDFKNKNESRFNPGVFPNNVKCDRNFGDNDNIWKIDYKVDYQILR